MVTAVAILYFCAGKVVWGRIRYETQVTSAEKRGFGEIVAAAMRVFGGQFDEKRAFGEIAAAAMRVFGGHFAAMRAFGKIAAAKSCSRRAAKCETAPQFIPQYSSSFPPNTLPANHLSQK